MQTEGEKYYAKINHEQNSRKKMKACIKQLTETKMNLNF